MKWKIKRTCMLEKFLVVITPLVTIFFLSFPSILLNTVFSRLDAGGVYLKLDLVDSAFI